MLSDDSVRNFGLRAGRVYGIDVHIHWFLLIVIALRLLHMSISEVPEGYVKDWGKVFTIFSTFTIALVGSVFLHELGHAFAAFREGGSCERIVLWPLGGLAYCSAPQTPWAQFFVAAGGPLVTLALAVVGVAQKVAAVRGESGDGKRKVQGVRQGECQTTGRDGLRHVEPGFRANHALIETEETIGRLGAVGKVAHPTQGLVDLALEAGHLRNTGHVDQCCEERIRALEDGIRRRLSRAKPLEEKIENQTPRERRIVEDFVVRASAVTDRKVFLHTKAEGMHRVDA